MRIEVITPDGGVIRDTLRSEGGWEVDSLGTPFASWPSAEELGELTELGLLTDFYPMQPGTYPVASSTLVLDGVEYGTLSGGLTVHTEEVRWTGDRRTPFVQRGRLEGTLDGHLVEADFEMGSDDCLDKVVADAGCGAAWPVADYAEQTWQVGQWANYGCPQEILDVYIAGDVLTLGLQEGASAGGRGLECVRTYENAYRGLCGDDTRIELDGCTWALAAQAMPGSAIYYEPQFYVYGGTVGECATPSPCWVALGAVSHVSGA